MFAKYRVRYISLFLVVFTMFVVLATQLYSLTVAQGDAYEQQAQTVTQRAITLTGSRGTIMDSNGIPLAYDEIAYDVTFYKDPLKNEPSDRAFYTEILIDAIEIIEVNGGEIINEFNITKLDTGEFAYNFNTTDMSLHEKRLESWISNMSLNKTNPPTAEEAYSELRLRYRIPEEYSFEQALPLLSIWQQVQLSSYISYIPVVIAQSVDFNTVTLLEARSVELEGVDIEQNYVRVYPKNTLASNIIGYMGMMISEEEVESFTALGYSPEDEVGKVGIEASMEEYLTGSSSEKQGTQIINVSNSGEILEEVSYSEAKPGDNVILNIDLKLQQVAEQALEDHIDRISQLQMDTLEEDRAKSDSDNSKENYDELLEKADREDYNFVNSGAAIVMDVDSGDILAMASYPTYDLNLFAQGISKADLDALTQDPASPLFDKTISSKSTPGSIFKLATGVAGVMNGSVGLNETIDDEGNFTKTLADGADPDEGPECWTRYPQNHQDQDLILAIKNSCNYYFYEVAFRMGIDELYSWSEKFGLTSKTGIDLPSEATSVVGRPLSLYDPSRAIDDQGTWMPYLTNNTIMEVLAGFGRERGVEYTPEQLEEAAGKLIDLAADSNRQKGPEVREILRTVLEIPEQVSAANEWDDQIVWYLLELMWNDTKTITTGIGTEITQLTPIAVARYACAVLNGGEVLKPQIVDKIVDADGRIVEQTTKEVQYDIDIPDDVSRAVKEGMSQVISVADSGEDGGTAKQVFDNFEYKSEVMGKTGTAPVSTIDFEHNGWFIGAAPYDSENPDIDPEIVIIVFMPNGMSGTNVAYVAKDVLQYWYDEKTQTTESSIPASGSLLG